MSSATDPYREWDAAYVMGSLSPSERHEYEQHLTACSTCSDDVAELAGISGVLRAVPAEQAMQLLAPDALQAPTQVESSDMPSVPATLLPRFLDATRRSQSRARARAAAWMVGGLAAAATAVVVIAIAVSVIGPSTEGTRTLTMAQTQPGPITAEATLTEQSWGTTIDLRCSYATFFDGELLVEPWDYALFVIDTAGVETEQATWEAAPGSVVTPTATTALSINEIARIEIRVIGTGRVLLEASPQP